MKLGVAVVTWNGERHVSACLESLLASTVPLRIWSYWGGTVALFAMAFAIFITVRTIVSGSDVPGYASLMVAVLFLGAVNIVATGILGEYVGRIYQQVRRRPLVLIEKSIDPPPAPAPSLHSGALAGRQIEDHEARRAEGDGVVP